jgi:hypothetical protein
VAVVVLNVALYSCSFVPHSASLRIRHPPENSGCAQEQP